MKFRIIIDRDREEEVVVYARERSELTDAIEALVSKNAHELIGYNERETVRLSPDDVVCFTVEDNRVYAVTDAEKLRIKMRLYRVEELLNAGFVKINQSCIANIKKIDRFEASFSGSLLVRFKNGHTDYVSRRQVKTVKERLGL